MAPAISLVEVGGAIFVMLIDMVYEMKKYKIYILILMGITLLGLLYSLFYEISGYNIDFFPDVGTPADFLGVFGTIVTIYLTWQQIDKSQDQFSKNMEETYKPDLYMDTKERTFSISKDSNEVIPENDESESFCIANIGVGTAKNIIVEAYSKKNLNYLLKYAKADFNKIVDDNYILYAIPFRFSLVDNIKPENESYLFPKDHKDIPLPRIYLQILKDRIFELIDKKEIDSDPYVKLPKFKYCITYSDQEEIEYSKEVIIYAKCWDIRPDTCKVTLSVENKPAKKK